MVRKYEIDHFGSQLKWIKTPFVLYLGFPSRFVLDWSFSGKETSSKRLEKESLWINDFRRDLCRVSKRKERAVKVGFALRKWAN